MPKLKRLRKLSLAQEQKIWYKKLAASGFDDIEYPNGMMRRTVPESIDNNSKSVVLIESILDYYTMATHFLNEHKFETELDRVIWAYHAEGLGVRSISTVLKKARVCRLERTAIWTIVNRLEVIMKSTYGVK